MSGGPHRVLGVNGRRLTFTNDEAYELIMAVAAGEIDDVTLIAAELADHSAPCWTTSGSGAE